MSTLPTRGEDVEWVTTETETQSEAEALTGQGHYFTGAQHSEAGRSPTPNPPI